MTREWVQKLNDELYWKSAISPVDLTPVARAELAEVPEGAWVIGEVVAAKAGFLITRILSGPYPGPDLLSRATLALSSGRPREALLELDALGGEPTDIRRVSLRISALVALTPPASEEAETILLLLIRAEGWQPRFAGFAERIGWSERLAEAAAVDSLRGASEELAAIHAGVANPYSEPASAERFDRLKPIPPALLSNDTVRAVLSIGAAHGVAERHLGYFEQIRAVLESRAAFDESAAEAFAAIDASCARRRGAHQEWQASRPERFLLRVEEYFGCVVPRALRSRWRAAVGGPDVVSFLADYDLFSDGERWSGPELRGEASHQDVRPVLPFAEASPDDPTEERMVYLALDLSHPTPGEGGEIDYPVIAFAEAEDGGGDAGPAATVRRVADSSRAWLASLSEAP